MKQNAQKRPSDGELLQQYCDGDEQAFRLLVDRYKNGLYGFLGRFLNHRALVEDVFQETFVQLYISRESFDKSRPLRPWLFTIAANKAKDALRKRQRTAAVQIGSIGAAEEMSFTDVLNVLSCQEKQPAEELQKDEIAASVRRIIADMPEHLREILILAYFNKFSYKQMTEILSIPIGTVKSRLHTAVGRFAREWKESVGTEK